MYMNSAPRLLSEDRPEFESVLDEVLHDEDTRLALSRAAAHLDADHLRTLALHAADSITAAAADEYEEYLRIREDPRISAAPRRPRPHTPGDDPPDGERPASGAATAGAGLLPTLTVLTPMLAGSAGAIFLFFGYLLELMTPDPAIAGALRTAGWLFAAIAFAGLMIGMVALLLTALRNTGSASGPRRIERSPAVAEARARWREALRERGVRPYVRQMLAVGAAGGLTALPAAEPHRRTPPLGYSSPGFSSPNPGYPDRPGGGPRYSSPDFTSPDFSSPDYDTGAPDQPGAERA
jgi:hypothetical protein